MVGPGPGKCTAANPGAGWAARIRKWGGRGAGLHLNFRNVDFVNISFGKDGFRNRQIGKGKFRNWLFSDATAGEDDNSQEFSMPQ